MTWAGQYNSGAATRGGGATGSLETAHCDFGNTGHSTHAVDAGGLSGDSCDCAKDPVGHH